MAKLDKLLGQAQEHLEPGEQVLAAVEGTHEIDDLDRASIMVATDRRVFLYSKKLVGRYLQSLPYADISSFESKRRFRMQLIVVGTGSGWRSKSYKLENVKPDGLEDFVATVESRVGGGSAD
jgi:hypothetical protein